MLEGDLPKRALNLILEWAKENQKSLIQDWNLCTEQKMPHKIKPLK